MNIKAFHIIILLCTASTFMCAQGHMECDTTTVNSYGEYCEQLILLCGSYTASEYDKLEKLRDSIYVERDSLINFGIHFKKAKFEMAYILDEDVYFMERLRSFQDYGVYIDDERHPIVFNQALHLDKREKPYRLKLISQNDGDYVSIKYKLELNDENLGEQKNPHVLIKPSTHKIRISNLEIRLHEELCYKRVSFPEIMIFIE